MKKDTGGFEKVLHPDAELRARRAAEIETKAEAIEHVRRRARRHGTAVDFTDTNVRVQGDTARSPARSTTPARRERQAIAIKLVVLSVWVKGSTGWQMIARQATRPEVKS